jgi:hypothetical protein
LLERRVVEDVGVPEGSPAARSLPEILIADRPVLFGCDAAVVVEREDQDVAALVGDDLAGAILVLDVPTGRNPAPRGCLGADPPAFEPVDPLLSEAHRTSLPHASRSDGSESERRPTRSRPRGTDRACFCGWVSILGMSFSGCLGDRGEV